MEKFVVTSFEQARAELKRCAEIIEAKSPDQQIGIAVKQGLFTVTRTTKAGRKWTTDQLTGFQSYGQCLDHVRAMAGE